MDRLAEEIDLSGDDTDSTSKSNSKSDLSRQHSGTAAHPHVLLTHHHHQETAPRDDNDDVEMLHPHLPGARRVPSIPATDKEATEKKRLAHEVDGEEISTEARGEDSNLRQSTDEDSQNNDDDEEEEEEEEEDDNDDDVSQEDDWNWIGGGMNVQMGRVQCKAYAGIKYLDRVFETGVYVCMFLHAYFEFVSVLYIV
jgi:hypothetical protein